MLHVSIQPDQFFLNIAAINQQRRLLQQALRFHLASNQFLHARLQSFDIGLQHRLAMLLHTLAGLLHVGHALPQLAVDAAPFFFAHLVEVVEQFLHLGQDGRFQRAIGRKRGCSSAPGRRRTAFKSGSAARPNSAAAARNAWM